MCYIGVLNALLVRLFNLTYVKGSHIQSVCVICVLHSVADDHYRLWNKTPCLLVVSDVLEDLGVPISSPDSHGVVSHKTIVLTVFVFGTLIHSAVQFNHYCSDVLIFALF